MTRIPYRWDLWIKPTDSVVLKRYRYDRERIIKPGKWYIDRNTPVGDDARFYERKPYGGKREVPFQEIVAILRPDTADKGNAAHV
jgi:hypothetical protein